MDEPEPDYSWTGTPRWDFEAKVENGARFFRIWDKAEWLPLTDERLEEFGFVKAETLESRLARAEWRITQLEAELQERRDWAIEMQERE